MGVTVATGLPPVSTLEHKNLKTILSNSISVYGQLSVVTQIADVAMEYPEIWEDKGKFIDLPQDDWMRIPLKPNWEEKVSGKAKVYPLGSKDRQVVDDTFDKLHHQGHFE